MSTGGPPYQRYLFLLVAGMLVFAGCSAPAPDPPTETEIGDQAVTIDPGVLRGLTMADDQIGWGNVLTGMTAQEVVTTLNLKVMFQEPLEGDFDPWIMASLYDESIIWFDGKGLDVHVTRIFLPMPQGWDESHCLDVLEQLFTDLEYAEGADSPGGDGAEGPSKLYLFTDHPELGIRLSADGLWLGNEIVRAILPLTSPS
jgi:hypothetical protein